MNKREAGFLQELNFRGSDNADVQVLDAVEEVLIPPFGNRQLNIIFHDQPLMVPDPLYAVKIDKV